MADTITSAQFPGYLVNTTVTIANGATVSGAAVLGGGLQLVAVQCPAALTSTAMTFTGSTDGTTYVAVYAMDGAAAYSITVGVDRIVPVDIRCFAGLAYVKCVAGSAEGGARVITLITRPV